MAMSVNIKVAVLSKVRFDELMREKNITNENVEERKDILFISINDTLGTDAVPYFTNHKNVKVLYFDDVEEDLETNQGIAKAFTEQQAAEIIEFLEQNKHVTTAVIHCTAGISRSGAVGLFVNDYFGGEHQVFKVLNPHTLPNGKVSQLLNRKWHERRMV